jgi:CheY-like chemotaxis protein
MTAHAMKGDRERCLAGGMDGYLSKPIRASQLTQVLADFDVLAAHGDGTAAKKSQPLSSPKDSGDGDILDRGAIFARVGHDRQLLKDLIAVFLAECPRLLDAVRLAVANGNAPQLKVAAHAVKGTVSNFSTWPAFEAALRLETMGHTGDLTHVAEGLAALESAMARLTPALTQLASEGSQ